MFQCITQPRSHQIYHASELKYVFPDIRVQLSEQFKCLDGRLETQQSIVTEIQDVFRRRAEIETNYSKELDKLAKSISHRNKEQRQKRDAWAIHSSTQIWETVLVHTKRTSKDHKATAEIYGNHVVQRCHQINEDLQRIHRRCREIGYEIHEEVLKVLHELHTTMKTHHAYQSEFRQSENKLQMVERQKVKLEQSVPIEKRAKHRKFRILEKEFQKRRLKFDEARLAATKARNEYLLAMDAANASIQKYFVDDLSDLIDCLDFGFHQSLTRAVSMHTSAMEQQKKSLQKQIDKLNKVMSGMDSRLDKQKFIESNNTTFMIPKKFELAQARRDETEVIIQKCVLNELSSRKSKLEERLALIKAESEEIWKSMDSAEKTLSDIVGCKDYDTTRFFVEEDRASLRISDSIVMKQKADRLETEDFYINKFREYVLNSNRIARLQAKYDNLRHTLGDKSNSHASAANAEGMLTLTRRPNVARRRRIGNNSRQGGGQPKLFGGSLEEYLEETNQELPIVVRSCVRVINLYGLHHHGIFRVSGSQLEINNFRDAFERGDDPLADMTDASDINSVAGVMKLYLRELREPVFPIQYFDHFMELAREFPPVILDSKIDRKKLESKHEFVLKVQGVVQNWPRPVFIVMRYIFAFLNHLSEFSDENMMDPYNLAICFGPTLVPIPEERDQVQYQNLVNELIKNFIIFHDDIFPSSVPGPIYEKYITNEPEEMGDSPPDSQNQDENDDDSEMAEEADSVFSAESERDGLGDISMELFGRSEALEALAVYDFKARSSREVTFHKGDTIQLFKQVSNDWWRGRVKGQEGLIPDKYIILKIRGEEDSNSVRDRLDSARSVDEGQLASLRDRSLSLNLRSRTHSNASEIRTSSLSPTIATRSPEVTIALTPVSGDSMPSHSQLDDNTDDSGHPTSNSEPVSISHSEARAAFNESSRTEDGSGPEDELFLPSETSPHVVTSAQTHIIRVSGPVTNLDDTIVSAQGPSGANVAVVRTSQAHVRQTEPPSKSNEVESKLLLIAERASQESLASSTDSNQELQKQLSTKIAQVEALTQEVEKRTKVSSSSLTTSSNSISSPNTSQDRNDRLSVNGGARPRRTSRDAGQSEENVHPAPPTAEEGVVLKQSSWGSRENTTILESETPKPESFSRNKSMWEKRVTVEPASEPAQPSPPGGFRSNRNYWDHKLRNKDTPDLVLDLPVSSKPSTTTSRGTPATSPSDPSSHNTPVPKPRTLGSASGQRASIQEESGATGSSRAGSGPAGRDVAGRKELFRQAVVKPQVVRVKPHVQVRTSGPGLQEKKN
ncbi:SLIT-ROBO Rho GTPase-activating protein 1-like isoform X3 [Tigriopus californicus]|uniref:SLIT-ROBO Rho GTPase-activating protein 1-like isoform X3 n=1 Tax=Tigriopus californicus TaxID=6832 RepID=UPI0027DAA8F4|nr:SLIT-ROBO Rho GTPase-activating protein 1-like isoform X3 [Tigriopus californicus]